MTKKTGMNNQNLKYQNRGLLLRLLCTHDGVSRIQLAQRTGLTKMTVSNIIAGLMEQDYVVERAPERNAGVGRNPIILDISPGAPKVLGVQLGRDSRIVRPKTPDSEEGRGTFCTREHRFYIAKAFPRCRPNSHTGKQYLGVRCVRGGTLGCGQRRCAEPAQLLRSVQFALAASVEQPHGTASGAEQRYELRCVGGKAFWGGA